jgi:hypothetical protein
MFFGFFADFVSGPRNVLAGAFDGVARTQKCGSADNHDKARERNGKVLTHDGIFLPWHGQGGTFVGASCTRASQTTRQSGKSFLLRAAANRFDHL